MTGDVKVRIVRSDGQELTLGDGDWRIPSDGLENWANLTYDVSSVEIPSYDGALVTSKRVSSQDRSIHAVCCGSDPYRIRERAIRFFNPKYTFEAHITYMGRTLWTKGQQIGFKMSEWNIYKKPELDWSILCPNPYLLSEGNFGKDIAEIIPMFGFPFMSFLPESDGSIPGFHTGFAVSLHAFAQDVDITNDGDVPSGMRVIIRANGDVTNPSVRVGDGYIRVLTPMQQGDEIEMDASSRPPKVTMNGQNAMQKLDRNSSILDMMIQVGETTIEYDADDGYQNMSVSVFFNKQYLGV